MFRSIEKTINNLTMMIDNISSHACNTAATAEELTAIAQDTNESAIIVSNAVDNIAEGATGQANDTIQAAYNIEENSTLLTTMIEILNELKTATKNIEEKKNEGKDALSGLITASKQSKLASETVNEIIVDKIAETSKQIEEKNSQMIGVIQNLSAIAEENAATTKEASTTVETQTHSINEISSANGNLAEIASELQSEISNFKY